MNGFNPISHLPCIPPTRLKHRYSIAAHRSSYRHLSRITMVNEGADAAPVMGSKEATFTELAREFQFSDEIKKLLLDSHMTNLEDFRYYFADEKEIDAFCA